MCAQSRPVAVAREEMRRSDAIAVVDIEANMATIMKEFQDPGYGDSSPSCAGRYKDALHTANLSWTDQIQELLRHASEWLLFK